MMDMMMMKNHHFLHQFNFIIHWALQLVGPISADSAKALPADLSAFVEGGQVAGQGQCMSPWDLLPD